MTHSSLRFSTLGLPLLLLTACGDEAATGTAEGPKAPVAKVVPHAMTEHGQVRHDDYFWMRLSDAQKEAETPDAQTQDVLDYLNAENDYRKAHPRTHRHAPEGVVRRDGRSHQAGR